MLSRTDALGQDTLYAVIGAIARGPDLGRVLPAVVDLLADATGCHACFVYLRDDDVLTVRAASPIFARAVGRVSMRVGEGLTGWVARHGRPAFIREDALTDPRVRYFPELEEERFQSMAAVPLLVRDTDVIGVVVLHTEAPREFGQDVMDFLVHVASLVAGAVDGARLFERSQQQVAALEGLVDLGRELTALVDRDALRVAAARGVERLLGGTCRLVLAGDRDPGEALVHDPAGGRIVRRLVEQDRELGAIEVVREAPCREDDVRLLEACANQLAVALDRAELIAHLAAEGVARDVFAALEDGRGPAAAARARAAGWDAARAHVVVEALPARHASAADHLDVAERVERRLRWAFVGALADVGDGRLRALVPAGAGLAETEAAIDAIAREEGAALGVSTLRTGLVAAAAASRDPASPPARPGPSWAGLHDAGEGLREARDAARVAQALDPDGGARAFGALGAYRYLAAGPVRDTVHAAALAALEDYDRARGTALVTTLERHLHDRGATAKTAEALVVHPNTLRQRLARIAELTGLDLEREDLLSLELAVKSHRLRPAVGVRDAARPAGSA